MLQEFTTFLFIIFASSDIGYIKPPRPQQIELSLSKTIITESTQILTPSEVPRAITTTTPILDWPDISGASYYYVQVQKDGLPVVEAWPRTSQHSVPEGRLSKGITYTWFVRARYKDSFSDIIAEGVFTIVSPYLKVGLPAPEIIYPPNDTTISTLTPILDWTDVEGSEGYCVQVYVDVGEWPGENVICEFPDTSEYQVPEGKLWDGYMHRWFVWAWDEETQSWGDQGGEWRFTVNVSGCPPKPTLLSPLDGWIVGTTTTTLAWRPLLGADDYEVRIFCGTTQIDSARIEATEHMIPIGILLDGNTYTWWVRGHNENGAGPQSESWDFNVDTTSRSLTEKVAIIVDEAVYDSIRPQLLQYVNDVTTLFSNVTLLVYHGIWDNETDLRSFIIDLYNSETITGAVLVGLLPYAKWEADYVPEGTALPFYYEDLDGSFSDRDENGLYDYHTWGSNDGPEIWVSMMRPPEDNALPALRDYLGKCYTYYRGGLFVPKKALVYVSHDWWGARDIIEGALFPRYGHNIDAYGGRDFYTCGREYLELLGTDPGYEIVDVWSHASSDFHQFDRGPIYYNQIRDVTPGGLMIMIWGCSVGDFYTEPSNNIMINYAFGNENCLSSFGVTRPMGTGEHEKIYEEMDRDATLGSSFFTYLDLMYDLDYIHSTWPDISDNKFVYDFLLIGNPFLLPSEFISGPPFPPRFVVITPFYMGLELAWEPSRESDVVGYNVYRSTTSGSGYEKINQSLLIDTTCQDTGLLGGVWYYYCVTAIDTGGLESDYSEEVSGIPISLDHGILVVDETRNGTGAPGSPNDAQVDSFYRAILAGYDFTEWDVDSLGKPSIYDLGPYSPIIWHGDDYASQELSSVIPDIKRYLDEGGRLWLCGWRPIMAAMGSGTYPFTFGEGDFPYDYLKLLDANESTSNDFTSAWGGPAISAYSDISVDSTKVPLSWEGRMKYVDIFTPLDGKSVECVTGVHHLVNAERHAVASWSGTEIPHLRGHCTPKEELECISLLMQYHAEPIYFFNSASGDTSFQDKPCGIRYMGEDYKLVFFGFPLYFMKEDEATIVAQKVLSDLEVGVEETTPIPEISALYQNYPNPFRGKTDIRFQISDCSGVSLKIYDITGRLVKTLVDGYQSPGHYTVGWNGRDDSGNKLGAGVYFVKFKSDRFTSTRKVVLLR